MQPVLVQLPLPHTELLTRLRSLSVEDATGATVAPDVRTHVHWRQAVLTIRRGVARWFGPQLWIRIEPDDTGSLALVARHASTGYSIASFLAFVAGLGVVMQFVKGAMWYAWWHYALLGVSTALWLLGQWSIRRETPRLLATWAAVSGADRSTTHWPRDRPQRLGRAGVYAELLESGWMHRRWWIQTPKAVRAVEYTGQGWNWDGVDVDGDLVAQDKSTWLRAQRLSFDLDGQQAQLVVHKWPWFCVRRVRLTLEGSPVFEG